jgi:hypothetical protein
MMTRMLRSSFLGFVLVYLCLVGSAFADKASRIELKGGEIYENVNFSVDEQYKLITIEKGDWKRPVSFPNILRIIDENGRDVTGDYLGEYYKPPEPIQKRDWKTEEIMEQEGYKKQPFGFGIRLGANYSFPVGDWYDGTKSGIGYGLDAIIPVTKNMAIRGTISRSGMQNDLESMLDPGVIVLDDNLSMNVWRYAISGQYYKWPRWRTGGKLMYYFYVGLGAITHKFSGTMTVKEPYSGEIIIIYPTGGSQDKFMLTYGGGLVPMLTQRLGLELGLTADLVFAGSTTDYYGYQRTQTAMVFDIKVGLVAVF